MTVEPTTDQSVFEGLFTRVLKPEGAFAAELRSIGYDPAAPLRQYPTRIFRDALRVACRHVHPEMPEPEALWALGAQFIEGFFETIVGKVVAVALPFLSAEAMVRRIPKFVTMTATGIEVVVVDDGEHTWRLVYKGQYLLPQFVAGTMRGGLRRSKLKRVELGELRPDGFDLILGSGAKA